MDLKKDKVTTYIKSNTMHFRGMWIVGMNFIVWMLDLITVIGNMNNMINILVSTFFTLSNIIVTVTTFQYTKKKTILKQNINLGALTTSLFFFLLIISIEVMKLWRIDLSAYIYYFITIITLALIYLLIKIRWVTQRSNKIKKVSKQDAQIASSVALLLYLVFRFISSSLTAHISNIFNWIIFTSGAILEICMSVNYFLKAYLIKKYDLDEPVKIIEE